MIKLMSTIKSIALPMVMAVALGALPVVTACRSAIVTEPSTSDLVFDSLATRWDEAIPLGNAHVGALVWKNGDALRFSLDRADLWDLRPMDSISGPNNRFAWVKEQIKNGTYQAVQAKYDWPYDREAAPSKIPGGAIEFPLGELGDPENVRLYINDAVCEIVWPEGVKMLTFVQSDKPMGWFYVENAPEGFKPVIVAPSYASVSKLTDNAHSGADLERLGYEQGDVVERDGGAHYRQHGWGDFYYDIDVAWKRAGNNLVGVWSITSSNMRDIEKADAKIITDEAMERGLMKDYATHSDFWKGYWSKSSVSLPDSVLQKQYDNEMYKFGSVTRSDSYPISLQAVWTADNGKLPPWKGDYHHDLNTQLSYWPTYTGNHLDEGLGYLNTLWSQRDTYKAYTKSYFETDGMNVPGVCALNGAPMGGWIQYAMSQTAGAWLAYHFYLHWKYSDDDKFLKEMAYPFINDVAIYMEQNSMVDENGVRRLEYSSSPEIFDNSVNAWFTEMTNYDQALMHSLFAIASEVAEGAGHADEAEHWKTLYGQLADFDVDADGSLTFAKGFPYDSSHRHFSHAMAIYPLGLLDVSNGEEDKRIIDATIRKLDEFGSGYWTGYSFAWLGNLKARALDGDGAADALRTFATCFCSPNTFHLNGDQSGTGKSYFTYRPFTLEGNFAFASGIQEMLLQSHAGVINIFPAIPSDWRDVSFENLRAQGGILVSARMVDGKVTSVKLESPKQCTVKVAIPGYDVRTVELPAGCTELM